MTVVPPAVVCVGIATIDAIVVVERLPGSDERVTGLDGVLAGGGVAATAAVTLAHLGVPVRFVGRIGDDASGRLIRDGLADVATIRAGYDAGYDHLHVYQVGPKQEGFFRFSEEEILPRVEREVTVARM